MLHKVTDEGKDWDQFLPYLLFAYREVPQASTGFSPFELLYGQQVCGPLDVLRETWEVRNTSKESIVSYVLAIQDRLMKLQDLVKDNLVNAQTVQKAWYDRNARDRELNPGDKVLVLLPTSINKLLAEWQLDLTSCRPSDIRSGHGGQAMPKADLPHKHASLVGRTESSQLLGRRNCQRRR